jgi:hypothetical protein
MYNVQEDPDTIDRLIADAEASYNKWRHPDPYIGKKITHSRFDSFIIHTSSSRIIDNDTWLKNHLNIMLLYLIVRFMKCSL